MAVEDIKSDSGFETATKGCKESAHLYAHFLPSSCRDSKLKIGRLGVKTMQP